MSKENRLRKYKELKAKGKLSQDDGALEKEFGKKRSHHKKPEPKPELEPKTDQAEPKTQPATVSE